MTIPRRVVFAFAASVLSVAIGVAILFSAELWVHHRFEPMSGLNIRGYRGPVVDRKQPDERRIVALGGSTVLGFGVVWDEAFPGQLEQILNAAGDRLRASVVNLGYNNDGAYAMKYTLDDYAYLQPDLAILYEGYNDLYGQLNTQVFRHQFAVFRVTGYLPLLPIVLREKAMALRAGDLRLAYRGDKVVFRPNLAQRSAAATLEAASAINLALDHQLGKLREDWSVVERPAFTTDEDRKISYYCDWIEGAVRLARTRGTRVLVVGQPYRGDRHVQQQLALAARLNEWFGTDPGVRYLNLGHAVDLKNPSLTFDGMHLTKAGNRLIAKALADSVRSLLTQ